MGNVFTCTSIPIVARSVFTTCAIWSQGEWLQV